MYLINKTHIEVLYSQNVETFLGSVLCKVESNCFSSSCCTRIGIKTRSVDFPAPHPYTTNDNPISRFTYYPPSSHHISTELRNINLMSIGSGVCHLLRPDKPYSDYHWIGNLILSAGRDLTFLAVTCANIRTSTRSTMGYPFSFIAEWNTLLPLMNFIEEACELSYNYAKWNQLGASAGKITSDAHTW